MLVYPKNKKIQLKTMKITRMILNFEINRYSNLYDNNRKSRILISALERSHESILFIIKKTKFWDKYRKVKLTKQHIQFLDAFIDSLSKDKKNEFSNNDYREITGTSPVTASRHIKKLLECGCIEKIEGKAKRNASYILLLDEDELDKQ